MRTLKLGLGVAIGLTAVGALVVYPWLTGSRVDALFDAGGCSDRVPPTAAFYQAIALGERVSRFPGFDKSDVIAAESSLCVSSFALACLSAESETGDARTRRCAAWHDYAIWVREFGVDVPGICTGCSRAELGI